MSRDPIVDEVRRARETEAAKHAFDIKAILAAAKRRPHRSWVKKIKHFHEEMFYAAGSGGGFVRSCMNPRWASLKTLGLPYVTEVAAPAITSAIIFPMASDPKRDLLRHAGLSRRQSSTRRSPRFRRVLRRENDAHTRPDPGAHRRPAGMVALGGKG